MQSPTPRTLGRTIPQESNVFSWKPPILQPFGLSRNCLSRLRYVSSWGTAERRGRNARGDSGRASMPFSSTSRYKRRFSHGDGGRVSAGSQRSAASPADRRAGARSTACDRLPVPRGCRTSPPPRATRRWPSAKAWPQIAGAATPARRSPSRQEHQPVALDAALPWASGCKARLDRRQFVVQSFFGHGVLNFCRKADSAAS